MQCDKHWNPVTESSSHKISRRLFEIQTLPSWREPNLAGYEKWSPDDSAMFFSRINVCWDFNAIFSIAMVRIGEITYVKLKISCPGQNKWSRHPSKRV
jgi:hypothetical protein